MPGRYEEPFSRGQDLLLFQLGSETRRDLYGLQLVIAHDPATDASDLSPSDRLATIGKLEGIRNRFSADGLNANGHVKHILKRGRAEKITTCRYPRKTDPLAFPGQRHAQAARAKKFHLGRLHETEKVGEVNDAGHVGVGEFNAASSVKSLGHG